MIESKINTTIQHTVGGQEKHRNSLIKTILFSYVSTFSGCCIHWMYIGRRGYFAGFIDA